MKSQNEGLNKGLNKGLKITPGIASSIASSRAGLGPGAMGAPLGAGNAVPVVEAGLEEAPAGVVAPVDGEAEGGQGLGVAAGGVSNDEGAESAVLGDAEEGLAERAQVELCGVS